jgi:hypothetical protein
MGTDMPVKGSFAPQAVGDPGNASRAHPPIADRYSRLRPYRSHEARLDSGSGTGAICSSPDSDREPDTVGRSKPLLATVKDSP